MSTIIELVATIFPSTVFAKTTTLYHFFISLSGSNQYVTSQESKAIAEAAAAVSAACNKWLSESSGIFTASTQTGSSTNR